MYLAPAEQDTISLHVDASTQAIGWCYENNSQRGATVLNPMPHAPIYVAEIVACFYGLLEIHRNTIMEIISRWVIKTDNIIALAFFQKARCGALTDFSIIPCSKSLLIYFVMIGVVFDHFAL